MGAAELEVMFETAGTACQVMAHRPGRRAAAPVGMPTRPFEAHLTPAPRPTKAGFKASARLLRCILHALHTSGNQFVPVKVWLVDHEGRRC